MEGQEKPDKRERERERDTGWREEWGRRERGTTRKKGGNGGEGEHRRRSHVEKGHPKKRERGKEERGGSGSGNATWQPDTGPFKYFLKKFRSTTKLSEIQF